MPRSFSKTTPLARTMPWSFSKTTSLARSSSRLLPKERPVLDQCPVRYQFQRNVRLALDVVFKKGATEDAGPAFKSKKETSRPRNWRQNGKKRDAERASRVEIGWNADSGESEVRMTGPRRLSSPPASARRGTKIHPTTVFSTRMRRQARLVESSGDDADSRQRAWTWAAGIITAGAGMTADHRHHRHPELERRLAARPSGPSRRPPRRTSKPGTDILVLLPTDRP